MSFLSKLLGVISGNKGLKVSEQLLFDKVIGFRGVTPGVGTSTIVQNTAIALSESSSFSICVLDTSYLYPTQYPMLVNKPDQLNRKDLLDFAGDLSEIITLTSYRNVSLVSMSNRTVVDMLSSADSELTVEKLMGALKSYFDVVLVDLSYETTNIATHSAIKCNRIINVVDQSLKSIYHLRKSINTMVTLAVPLAKADRVIINKVVPDVLSNTNKVIADSGLKVIGEIPFSQEIAKAGVTGKRLYAPKATNRDIYTFSSVISSILTDVIQTTPLTEKYTDGSSTVTNVQDDLEEEIIEDEIIEDDEEVGNIFESDDDDKKHRN